MTEEKRIDQLADEIVEMFTVKYKFHNHHIEMTLGGLKYAIRHLEQLIKRDEKILMLLDKEYASQSIRIMNLYLNESQSILRNLKERIE